MVRASLQFVTRDGNVPVYRASVGGEQAPLSIDGDSVRFVLEADSPDQARKMEPVRAAAEAVVARMQGVARVAVTAVALFLYRWFE